MFENNKDFHKKLLANDQRPFYFAFVRHWVASALQSKFPAVYRGLPKHFSNGLPV